MPESAVVRRRTAVLIAFACLAAGCGTAESEVEAKPAATKQSAKSAVKKIVKRYLAASADGDGEAACKLLDEETVAGIVDDGKTRTPEEAFTLCVETITNLATIFDADDRKQLKHPKFTSVKVKGRTATVRVTFTDDPVKLEYTDERGWLIADAVS